MPLFYQPSAYITHNATEPPTVLSEIWVYYVSIAWCILKQRYIFLYIPLSYLPVKRRKSQNKWIFQLTSTWLVRKTHTLQKQIQIFVFSIAILCINILKMTSLPSEETIASYSFSGGVCHYYSGFKLMSLDTFWIPDHHLKLRISTQNAFANTNTLKHSV